MLRLIQYHLSKHRVQSFSVLFSVLISTAVIFALILLYLGVTSGLKVSNERLGADILVMPKDAESMLSDTELLFTGAPVMMYMPESALDTISDIEGVEAVTAQIYGQTLNKSCCSSTTATRLIGYDPSTDWVIAPWAEQSIGRDLAEDEIILGGCIDGFDGDSGQILGKDVKVVARLEQTGTTLDYSILMNMDAVRALSASEEGFQHYWDKYGSVDTLVSCVLVKADKEQQQSIINLIEIRGKGEWVCVASSDVTQELQGQLWVIFKIMFGAAVLLVIASLTQMFGRYYTMAWDRRSEMGLYRALGASNRFLQKLIAGEALLLTLAGTLVGILAGYGLYRAVYFLLAQNSAFPFIFPSVGTVFGVMAALLLLSLLFAILAVWIPLLQSKRIDPMLAMQKNDID